MVRVPSPPQSWPKAVVCVSTPRMYPRSGYFLVYYKSSYLLGYILSLSSSSHNWTNLHQNRSSVAQCCMVPTFFPRTGRIGIQPFLAISRHDKPNLHLVSGNLLFDIKVFLRCYHFSCGLLVSFNFSIPNNALHLLYPKSF